MAAFDVGGSHAFQAEIKEIHGKRELYFLYEHDALPESKIETQYDDSILQVARAWLLDDIFEIIPFPEYTRFPGVTSADTEHMPLCESGLAITKDGKRFEIGLCHWDSDVGLSQEAFWNQMPLAEQSAKLDLWEELRSDLRAHG